MPLRSQGYYGAGRGLSGLHWVCCNGRGPNLEIRKEPQGSSPFWTQIAGSLQSWDRRVRPRLVWRNGTPLDSRVVHGVTGHLSICMWNLRVFLDDAPGCHCPFVLCLDPQDCLRVGFCHRVLIKSGPGNWGLLACRTTHEAMSQISS